MTSIYILSNNNVFKIGKHTGNYDKLISRYTTSNINFNVILLKKYTQQNIAQVIENKIKTQYYDNRCLNINDNKSEWYNLSESELYDVKQIILSAENETKNTKPFSTQSMKYDVKYPNDIKHLYETNRIKTYKFQRPINAKRVNDIKKYIEDNYTHANFIMPPIFVNEIDYDYYILDGQHRIDAIRQLDDIYNFPIHFHITQNLNESQEKVAFININKSEPVPIVYLSDSEIKNIMNEFKTKLQNKYPQHIKSSSKCRMPNFCVDSIINTLLEIEDGYELSPFNMLYSHGYTTNSNELLEHFINVNNYISSKLKSRHGNDFYNDIRRTKKRHTNEDIQKNLKKIKKASRMSNNTECYLGLCNYKKLISIVESLAKLQS
jgi:hypothetical protein